MPHPQALWRDEAHRRGLYALRDVPARTRRSFSRSLAGTTPRDIYERLTTNPTSTHREIDHHPDPTYADYVAVVCDDAWPVVPELRDGGFVLVPLSRIRQGTRRSPSTTTSDRSTIQRLMHQNMSSWVTQSVEDCRRVDLYALTYAKNLVPSGISREIVKNQDFAGEIVKRVLVRQTLVGEMSAEHRERDRRTYHPSPVPRVAITDAHRQAWSERLRELQALSAAAHRAAHPPLACESQDEL